MKKKLNDGFVRAMFLITFFAMMFGAAMCVTKKKPRHAELLNRDTYIPGPASDHM